MKEQMQNHSVRVSAADRLNAALPPITREGRPAVLLVGNGINRADLHEDVTGLSWDEVIERLEELNGLTDKHWLISKLPASMKVIAATGGRVRECLSYIADLTDSGDDPDPRSTHGALWQRTARLPVTHVITTNYGFELENMLVPGFTMRRSQNYLYHTGADKSSLRAVLLNRFYKIHTEQGDKHFWHIHGSAYKPNSIVIDQYEYGKLVSYVVGSMQQTVGRILSAFKKGDAYTPKSWTDCFLTGDVYVLGFGMDPSEFDLWWLARCKARNFPETQIRLFDMYAPEERKLLFPSCGIEYVDVPAVNDEEFYTNALDMIERMLKA